MMRSFDVIVIGVGGMGSAALWHLARRGIKVLGIEQFEIGHDRGSSHGATRLIRRAYFEHPDYVPLVDRAYALWSELEKVASRKLLHRCGLMLAGRPDCEMIRGVRRAADAHHLAIETAPRADWPTRFAAFHIDSDTDVLFESDAGFLEVESCVRAQVDAACRHGATVLTGRRVQRWSADAREARVDTDGETFVAGHLLLCGGAWTGPLLSELKLPLAIRRKVVLWFGPADERYQYARGCPVFGFATEDGGFYYGFPAIDDLGVKVSDHAGGHVTDDADGLDREVRADDEAPLRRFVARYVPSLGTNISKRSVCMYTMTPDEHFIVDRHPDHRHVLLACGFSGHGFKFAPVIGQAMADWVTQDRTSHPVGFLRLGRPSLE